VDARRAREHTQHQVRTSSTGAGAILARNFFDPQFAGLGRVLRAERAGDGHTGDRREFLGRNGSVRIPPGCAVPARGHHGAGLDPCAALQCVLELAPGETREVVVILGAAAERGRGARAIGALRDVRARGDRARTAPSSGGAPLGGHGADAGAAFDAMLNRWTLYQALSCRMWARSALYQSSGAYGFRDQLQDVLAFVYAEPAVAREHILRAAARQFVEGDVQHWWHPQSGRGVRTRFSDDLAWLPYVVTTTSRVTGDAAVLDEYVPFLTMRALEPDEHEVYDLPGHRRARQRVRALPARAAPGVHRRGARPAADRHRRLERRDEPRRRGGRGESVWLAWFLTATLRAFAVHAAERAATPRWPRVPRARRRVRRRGGGARLGRRMVPPRLLRRRHAARLQRERRVPHRLHRAELERDLGRRRPDAAGARDALARGAPRGRRRAAAHAAHAALRPDAARPRLHQGLPARRAGERRAVHARRALGRARHRAARRRRPRVRAVPDAQPAHPRRTPEEVATYKVEPYVVAADVYTAPGQWAGGWTWYTGSASWMYRVGLEAILGFTAPPASGRQIRWRPCASSWSRC
jgi:cyclic beta-1,2-glucan synthetase